MRYFFEDYALDIDRRELHRGSNVVPTAPQVFDLLDYLIRNRERVVSKDDLVNAIWNGRIVSDVALTTRLNAARSAIGDCGDEQRLIKTLPRKGLSFRRRGAPIRRHVGINRGRGFVEARTGASRQALDRGVAVREHERRSRAAIFCRRNGRGDHDSAFAVQMAVRHRAGIRASPSRAGRSISRRSDASLACAMCLRGLCASRRAKFASQGN
ncbi:winged helix-turn-helix domain-containing protein [Bradyrhizobium sp. CCGB01]|uniref:winged helix-turn-helix domain-containing protein n=1 Tax=Bradyrhizobium sp. CCGB01 TaxID=2949634 RepID=UPI0020B2CE61|nr:winged helix-turn-helix domain-containing protein [Bradyrhizobium sp. CCGB01]MCP3409097.1 winged helix-turn-helix domain-containing protein [Bradyrhizobium sp. CCGB01]